MKNGFDLLVELLITWPDANGLQPFKQDARSIKGAKNKVEFQRRIHVGNATAGAP